jgi:hypothetical protein
MKPILRTILSNPPTSSESLDNYCKRISGDQWNATKSKIKRFLKGMEYPMGMSGVQKIVAEFSPPGSKEERIETKDSIKVEYECDEPIPDMDLYKALGVPPGTPLEVKRRSWDVHMKVKVPIEAETGNVITRNYGKPFGRTITVPTIIKRTNHYVSAQVDKADIDATLLKEEFFSKVLSQCKRRSRPKMVSPKKPVAGVVAGADFHAGARVEKLMRTPDFDLSVLREYLIAWADHVNSFGHNQVVVKLLGDIIESWTGLNHLNVWKELDTYGVDAIYAFYDLFVECFVRRVSNLTRIDIVSGNHDRVTISKDLDMQGEGAKLLARMLQREFKNQYEINWAPLYISGIHDDIGYIAMHGDKGASKKPEGDIVIDKGFPGIFNMILEGHLHSRKVVKPKTITYEVFEKEVAVASDTMNCRRVRVASFFTGNTYSENLGFSAPPGFSLFERSRNGKFPNHYDICL